jgi:nucleoside-diphosphate-sugar epimerase
MSILITGGTGFIGAEIVRQLLNEGIDHAIHVAHRRGRFERIRDLIDQVTLHQLDLADPEAIGALVDKTRPDVIFHFGAVLTGPGQANPQSAVEANAIGTYALLEAARLADVRQIVFASSIGTYGSDIRAPIIDDETIQRPITVYGVTKVFGEHLGAFYRRRYGLDFRCLRYPSIIGPGVTTPSVVQYTSWAIEESAKGNAFTITVRPDFAVPVMYYKDAARAAIGLSRAQHENLVTFTYLVDGHRPTPTAAQLADSVRTRLPEARIDFAPDPEVQPMLDEAVRPIDDSRARAEWAWTPKYDLDKMVADFLVEMDAHPGRFT